MTWYKTGTATVTNSSAAVTGSGTLWVDAGTLNAGDIFNGPDGKLYEILTINSNTSITLASNYLGTTAAGASYSIMPIGLLPAALAQQVKTTLATANTALASAVRYDIATMGLSLTQQQNARTNIAALSALDVGAGRLSKSVSGGVDVTLTTAEASNQFIELTGTITANINVIVPAAARLFYVYNGTSGAFTVTVKTPSGTGVVVPNAARAMLECDATNVLSPLSGVAGAFTTLSASGVANAARFAPTGSVITSEASLALYAGGAWLNTPSATTGYLGVAGSGVAAWSSAGLAVTGNLSATGNTALGSTSTTNPSLTMNSDGSSYYTSIVGNAGGYGANKGFYIDTYGGMRIMSSGSIVLAPNGATSSSGTTVATISSTGLAVAGALSSTGNTSLNSSGTGVVTIGSASLASDTVVNYDQNNYYVFEYFRNAGTSYAYRVTGQNFGYGFSHNGLYVLNVSKNNSLALQGASTGIGGTGISFPATQYASTDPNTLDDYEEGTWTPTQGAGLTVTGTFVSSGNYVKVGRKVTVTGSMNATTIAVSAADTVICGGLPFVPTSGGPTYSPGTAVNWGALASFGVIAFQGTSTVFAAGTMASNTGLQFALTYFV